MVMNIYSRDSIASYRQVILDASNWEGIGKELHV